MLTQCPQLFFGATSSSSYASSEAEDDDVDDATYAVVWRCLPCAQEFASPLKLRTHMEKHTRCLAAGCRFSAPKEIVLSHIVSAHASGSQPALESMSPVKTGEERGLRDSRWTRDCPALFPADYVCKICRVPGHWMCDCPTNAMFEFREAFGSAGFDAKAPSGSRNWEPRSGSGGGARVDYSTLKWGAPSTPSNERRNTGAPAASPAPAARSTSASSSYCCKFCFEIGHWTTDCPTRPTDKLPPATYVCKICSVRGHWIYDCPQWRQSRAAQAPAPSLSRSQLPQPVSPRRVATSDSSPPSVKIYCCNACGIPGHSIFKCPMKLKRVDLAEAQQTAVHLQLQQQSQREDSGDARTSPRSALAARLELLEASVKPWRCEPCDKSFAVQSQLAAHVSQHVVCLAPGCEFAAAKRVVTVHADIVHG